MSREMIESTCIHCGAKVTRTRASLEEAYRKRGGPCCKACRYKKVSASNKGKGRYHCASSGKGIPL